MQAKATTGVGKWRHAPTAIVAAIILAASATTALAQSTERVSVATGGGQADNASAVPAISADGRFVAFQSSATDLVSGDTNGVYDIFVHDRQTGTTERVSVATGGTQATGSSSNPAISADGRFVAFFSGATNLVGGDTNAAYDIFVHDRQTGTTERVSVATGGIQATGGDSYNAAISADGRFVAFQSNATDLVSGDTNSKADVFVHDRETGTTERVSVATGGGQANDFSDYPAISADGRFVAFQSSATDLVSGDTNGVYDIFVHDRQTGTTERVSVATNGTQATGSSYNTAISADGRFVAFYSAAGNLVSGDTNGATDIFVHDRQTGTTERVNVATGGTEGNSDSSVPAISADGRFVAFQSNATDLVSGDTNSKADVFVHDRQTGTTERVSVATGGTQATGSSLTPALSADGRFVAFYSSATNLVSGDSNGAADIFVHDRGTSGAAPLAPLGLNATDIGDSAFTANWTGQDASAAGYRIDVATDDTFAAAAAEEQPADFVPGYQSKVILCVPNPCVPGTVSQVVSDVQPGDQKYFYRVQAWGRGGDSAFSDTVLANPTSESTALNPLVLAGLGLVAALGLLGKARRRTA